MCCLATAQHAVKRERSTVLRHHQTVAVYNTYDYVVKHERNTVFVLTGDTCGTVLLCDTRNTTPFHVLLCDTRNTDIADAPRFSTMQRLRKETETILDHCHARRTKKSRRSANTWWQKFCAVTELPVVLDLNFVRDNQRHHDKERGCGHHEAP